MSLLELDHVTKRRGGSHEHPVLHNVSLELHAGELVVVWGRRRSGRSTLLRLAAGVEAPDAGLVRFEGLELSNRAMNGVLGGQIGYCWQPFRSSQEGTVVDQLIVTQLARGAKKAAAKKRAWTALERTGAEQCGALRPRDLDAAESVRVMIARALTLQPLLLVIDEPTKGVDLLDRDRILLLLRSLADENIAILMSTSEAAALAGADRAMSLSAGELHGSVAPELAAVVPLRRPA